MVRACLVYLLLLSVTQSFADDDERNRHWAEGVYFPPIPEPAAIPANLLAVKPIHQQINRHNPWATLDQGGVYSQPPSPQSLGYPAVRYDPYQPSVSPGGAYLPLQSGNYVPEYYSPIPSQKYDIDGYEKNNHVRNRGSIAGSPRDNYRMHRYRNEDEPYENRYRSGPYNDEDNRYRKDYYNNKYDHGIAGAGSGYSSTYDGSGYRHSAKKHPYVPGLVRRMHQEDYGNSQPWELILPLSESALPFLPRW